MGRTARPNYGDFESHTERICDTGEKCASAAFLIATFPDNIQKIYRTLNAEALSTVWILLAECAGIAFLGSLFIRNLSLDKDQKTSPGFVEPKDTSGPG